MHENPLQGPFRLVGRKRVFQRKYLNVFLFVAASVSLAAARDLAVVSNKANSLSAITLPDLIKVCKGQNNRWPDGKAVTFIMRNPSAPEMKVFLEKVYELPESQVKDLITTANHGRTGHPAVMVVDSDEDLVNKVASIPGAIGVVDVYAINSSVAVVKVAGKLPLEPGYPLHGN
jgi:ABC-type phosphate transport system substrate-binding protein